MKASLLRIVLVSAVVSAVLGGAYGYYVHDNFGLGAALGAVFGAVLTALEAFVFQGGAGVRLRRLPFLVYFSLRAAAYVVLIVMIMASGVAAFYGPHAVYDIGPADFAFTLVMCVGGNLMYAIADLLGPGVLFAFAAGRYHRPRAEERALLFIDLSGSTAAAESLGEARFLDLLGAFIVDVSQAIVECGGEIYKYVGDEIIATWRLRPGRNDAAVVRACFAARARLEARRAVYERDFGVDADFRAALHAGVVILGEVGSFKKEIALIGDAMNTTARILDACRENGRRVLASRALVERLAGLPEGVLAEPMPPLTARGKSAPLEVVALERLEAQVMPEAAATAIGA